VLEIVEILGFENGEIITTPIYEFREQGEKNGRVEGELIKVRELSNKDKLRAAGL
jgi:pilus assembly protein CpaF